MKNPLTPAGIEPATFRFVAQHLNHCATAVPTYTGQHKNKGCRQTSVRRVAARTIGSPRGIRDR